MGLKAFKRKCHPPREWDRNDLKHSKSLRGAVSQSLLTHPVYCCQNRLFLRDHFHHEPPISCGPACRMWMSTIPASACPNFSPLLSSLTGPLASPARIPQQSRATPCLSTPWLSFSSSPFESKLPILLDPTWFHILCKSILGFTTRMINYLSFH